MTLIMRILTDLFPVRRSVSQPPALVPALIQAERFGPQRRVNGISLLLLMSHPPRVQGIRMVLPGSSPAASLRADICTARTPRPDIMTRVRDHMRAQPPRSAAPRKRRPAPA
jgi:hypothetical protein